MFRTADLTPQKANIVTTRYARGLCPVLKCANELIARRRPKELVPTTANVTSKLSLSTKTALMWTQYSL